MFYITNKNWDKILGYAEEAYNEHKAEIGGMSVMVKDKDGDWELQQPVILKQQITGSNTILDKDALAVYYTKQAKKMGKKEFRFCWWHSHHTMKAFWSGTDITAIDEFNEGDFSFALVVNLKGEYKFRVSVWQPVEVHQDVDLEIHGNSSRCTNKMKKEVEDLCSTMTYQRYGDRYATSIKWKKTARQKNQENLPFITNSIVANTTNDTISYPDIVDEVDALNEDMIEGSIKYGDYKKGIDDLNSVLNKHNSPYSVELISEAAIESLLYTYPGALIKSLNDPDMDWFNQSFGG